MSGQETQPNNRPQGKKPQNSRSAGPGSNRQGGNRQGSNNQGSKKQGTSKQGSNRQGQRSNNQGSRNPQRSGPARGNTQAPGKAANNKAAPVVVVPVKVAQTVVVPRPSPIRKVVIVGLGVLGLVLGAVVGLITGMYVLVILGVIVGAGFGVVVSRNLVGKAFDSAISLVPANDIDAQNEPRLFNLLASLCAVSGVQMPTVAMSRDQSFNVCVFGDPSNKGASHVIFTEGLLKALSRIELEGVIAACLARIKSGYLEAQTEITGVLNVLGGVVPATVQTKLLRSCAEAQEVFDADVKACGITRYPPGLIAAYEHFEDESTVTSSSSALVAHLWLANPLGEALPRHKQAARSEGGAISNGSGSTVDGDNETHPALATRIALLREI